MLKKLIFYLLLISSIIYPQVTNFNLSEYLQFYNSLQNASYSQLRSMHESGEFNAVSQNLWDDALFKEAVMQKYSLTNFEIDRIRNNGFVVTERLAEQSFFEQLRTIYHADLPVFISTDAILHAFHRSYDAILKDCEIGFIIPKLQELFAGIKGSFPMLENRYVNNTIMEQRLKDLDFYVTVPAKLLDNSIQPYFLENSAKVDSFIAYVYSEMPEDINFLSTKPRKIDFSQFKPRGHYTDIEHPILAKYFRAMMWLGRIELYLIPPKGVVETPTFNDVQRQIIISYLMLEAIENNNQTTYQNIEEIVKFFVGYQDNVTVKHLQELRTELNFNNSNYFTDSINTVTFQNALAQKSYAAQMILSQMLSSNGISGDSIKPASAFMLYGQRFVVDSYVTGNVVYDKIRYNNTPIRRMLPNPLDVLFALGNDAALQLLQSEIEQYKYAQNLGSVRYMIDSYQQDFWQFSFYNSWLAAIKALNPPNRNKRDELPLFMRTGAYWQQKMNTQLGSWAELRHDNLLYAKQSYTGIPICSYPYSYVEPFPDFYKSLKTISDLTITAFNQFSQFYAKEKIIQYFMNFKSSCDTLEIISQKELENQSLSSQEIGFLTRMMRYNTQGCSVGYDGWYSAMYYDNGSLDGLIDPNYIVADYHTSPADENGTIVGYVKHAGTGKVDLLITAITMPDGNNVAFVGPTYSFYDYTTLNFLRLTDEEWRDTYLATAIRPDWVNVYLANSNGSYIGEGSTLWLTGVKEDINTTVKNYLTAQNYPNPFNASTIINFNVPTYKTNANVKLIIYNSNGELIKTLVNDNLPSGNYMAKWDGTNEKGNNVASGVYLYTLKVDNLKLSSKMMMVK
jgi:hypothetical protein